MTVTDALKSVPIFGELEEGPLQVISERSRVRTFPAGHLVLMEQDEGKALYILLEGQVSIQRETVSGRTILIAQRGPGDHFGEMSLLDGLGHSADVVALVECRVLVVSREAFVKTVIEHPSVALAVIRTLTSRLREQTGDLTRAKSLDLMGRLCATLLDLADGEGALKGATQQHLANLTGSTRESVNRTLQSLQDAGHIELGRGVIRLLDPSALRRRAENLS
jgi:CRP/FNR family cyclic AMP-dependent transcriptional regulator